MGYDNHKIRIIFIGTAEFGVPSFKAILNDPMFDIDLVITQPDRPSGRKQTVSPSPIKLLAQEFKIPVVQPNKIDDLTDKIKQLHPDIIIVVAYAQLIPEVILNLPKYGCLNLHGSLLPKYRGASPIQAALLNQEKETGVTIIKMDKGLDTGSILTQTIVRLLPNDNTETLYNKLSEAGSVLLVNTLKKYLIGKIIPTPQDDNISSYAKKISKSDGLIDWTKPANEIETFIRAMTPWPTAWTWWQGKQIKIIQAQHQAIEINLYKPGKTFIYNRGLAVQCGHEAIIIRRLQLEGKKEMTSDEFLRGHQDFTGSVLG